MTTIEHAETALSAYKKVIAVGVAGLMGLGLAGCETGTGLFAANNGAVQPQAAVVSPPAQQAQQQRAAKVSIAPIIGAPDTVAKQLQAQLTANIQAQRITVAQQPTEKAEYTLRGYVVSAREKTRTKVSYIWDVTDQTGKRVNRITGEEVVVGPQQRDPWASVTPQVLQTIATKTATSLSAWLPAQQAVASAGAAINQTATRAATAAGAAARNPVPAVAGSLQRQQMQTAAANSGPTTGSISRPVTALVPTVTGAPGDGSVALTSAIQRELTRKGVGMATYPGTSSYRVQGRVVVGQGQNGKQPIKIDWDVTDPAGKKLGTVSQKNEIPQGSLDGKWGQAADAAAAAAAQGIVKLLPKPTRVN